MKTTFRFRLITAFLFAHLYLSFSALAATKYVSPAGSDANSGDSWAAAWLTLQYAADQIAAGDTVWVADGTYVGFDLRTTGTSTDPIVFITASSNCVIDTENPVTTDNINVENADYIEINGFRVIDSPRNGIRLVNAHNCIVRNTYCDNNFERGIFTGFTNDILIEYNECLNSIDEHGIYVSNSSDRSIIRYNSSHHNTRGGIQINADASQGGDGISTDPEIYGNIIYENGVSGGAAINLDGVQGAFIFNNLLYENHATGIALFQQDGAEPSINAVIVHNTIINASNARWCILAVNASSGAQVFNNILINQHPWRGSIALDGDAVPGFDSDYNIVVNSLSNDGDGQSMTLAAWQALGYDAHSMLADPLGDIFESPATGDFHLKSDAQAINTGSAALSFGVDEDIEGILRPQGAEHDIGAYEAESTLAIEEQEEQASNLPYQRGITISQTTISWSKDLSGTLSLFSIDGKLIEQVEISSPGQYALSSLIPGTYLATVHTIRGLQWSKAFVYIGN